MARPNFAFNDTSDEPRGDLLELIDAFTAESDNVDDAADKLLAAAKLDADIYAQLLGPYEVHAARNAVRAKFGRERRAIWNAEVVAPSSWERPTAPDDRVSALVRANSVALMDFRLPGGLPIGKATEAELRDGAAFYIERANDMSWKGRWLERVASALPNGKTVAEALTEAHLAAMREAVR